MDTLKLRDVVALTTALPDLNLRPGEVGVIIDVGPNSQYLVAPRPQDVQNGINHVSQVKGTLAF